MTLVLDLAPEIEAELNAAAVATGTDVAAFVVAAAREKAAQHIRPPVETKEQRRARIEAILAEAREEFLPLFGGSDDPIADFLAEKHADTAREEERLERLGL